MVKPVLCGLFVSLAVSLAPTVARAEEHPQEQPDIPEEVLRQEEIITEARSPIDGRPMTAAEYAELDDQLQATVRSPQLSPQVREIIFLLQVRRGLRFIAPFLIP